MIRILSSVCIVFTLIVAFWASAIAVDSQYSAGARLFAGYFALIQFYVGVRLTWIAGLYRMPVVAAVMVAFISWEDFWYYASQIGTTLGREALEGFASRG